MRAAIDCWSEFPQEIDQWTDRVEAEAAEAEQRWRREQTLLGR